MNSGLAFIEANWSVLLRPLGVALTVVLLGFIVRRSIFRLLRRWAAQRAPKIGEFMIPHAPFTCRMRQRKPSSPKKRAYLSDKHTIILPRAAAGLSLTLEVPQRNKLRTSVMQLDVAPAQSFRGTATGAGVA